MSKTKQQFDQNSALARSFKSPLFLVLAICLSVIFIAVIITTINCAASTAALGPTLGVDAGTASLAGVVPCILSLVFSFVSTLCAWLLFATSVTKGKLIGLRLHLAFTKIMNTFAIVFVSIVGAMVVGSFVMLALMSNIIKEEIIPTLESDLKPALEQIVDASGELEAELDDIKDAYYEMPQELRDMYGLDSAEEFEELIRDVVSSAEIILEKWDEIITFLETGFMKFAIASAVVYAIIIVAMCFISSSLKRTSKYIRALAEGKDGRRKAPFVASFIGGGVGIIGAALILACGAGISMANAVLELAPLATASGITLSIGVNYLVTAVTVIIFAIFFKQMNKKRAQEALVMVAADAVVEEVPVEAAVEAAVEAPVYEAPVEEAPVEEAPVEETYVIDMTEEAPAEEAPTEE